MPMDDQADPRGVQRNRPDDVGALASTVISVLRSRQAVSAEGLRQFVLDHLVRAILVRGSFDAGILLDELRGYRLSLDTLIDNYVPAAARVLGEQWVDDQINFADVTIGSLRLQSLLEKASEAGCSTLHTDQNRTHALIIVPQGEQHFLGASVVAAQLRRVGCEVSISYDEEFGLLSTRLMQDVPDLVLITCARMETLESAAQTVRFIRQNLKKEPVIALGGAVLMDQVDAMKETGVDIVTNVATEALAYCSKRATTRRRS